jgi:hypothetical protein
MPSGIVPPNELKDTSKVLRQNTAITGGNNAGVMLMHVSIHEQPWALAVDHAPGEQALERRQCAGQEVVGQIQLPGSTQGCNVTAVDAGRGARPQRRTAQTAQRTPDTGA